jgi:transposase-like protein
MQNLVHGMGLAILGLIGTAFILALVLLVLYEVRLIVRVAHQTTRQAVENAGPSLNGRLREARHQHTRSW